MIKSTLLLIACFCSGIFVMAQSTDINIDQSQFNWTGKAAFSSYALSGTLTAKSCDINIEDGTITEAKLIIDMTSLDAESKDLKRHLRSKDFFEVKKFPEAVFELSDSISFQEGEHQIEGQLKIKDQIHAQKVSVLLSQNEAGWQLSGQLFIDRTLYGIFYNSPNVFKNLKEQAIADEFTLDFVLVFNERVEK